MEKYVIENFRPSTLPELHPKHRQFSPGAIIGLIVEHLLPLHTAVPEASLREKETVANFRLRRVAKEREWTNVPLVLLSLEDRRVCVDVSRADGEELYTQPLALERYVYGIDK